MMHVIIIILRLKPLNGVRNIENKKPNRFTGYVLITSIHTLRMVFDTEK